VTSDERLRLILRKLRALTPPTLEELLTSEQGFGLTTATPLQRAVCRIADGLPLGELACEPAVMSAIGAAPPPGRPAELLLLSGIRTAKSLTSGALAVHWSQTCDVSRLGAGEVPRVSVVSLTTDLARVVFQHVVGNVLARPALRALVIGSPTVDTIVLRHPTGKPVEIKVVAGSRAGASLVARWSAGCVFDEAPKMLGGDEAVVNYDDARRAVIGRLLPGAQLVSIGSPWAPFGPIYETVLAHHGKPTRERVVIWAPAWDMNPIWWTPERVAHFMVHNPDAYQTECAAKFASPEESLFGTLEVERATREASVVPFDSRCSYVAAMDPATRGNAWTLVIATRVGNRRVVVLAREWVGSRLEPLKPRDVLSEIAAELRKYELDAVWSDQWSADALRDLGREVGVRLIEATNTEPEKARKYLQLKARAAEGELELPPLPALRTDLLRVKKRTTQTGVQIVLPKSSDGRHCDFAPAVMLALSHWLEDEGPGPDDEHAAVRKEVEAMRKRLERRVGVAGSARRR
jgi:hypothetical protein